MEKHAKLSENVEKTLNQTYQALIKGKESNYRKRENNSTILEEEERLYIYQLECSES